MNDDIARLKQDVQTIQTALGMDIWTRRDVLRGFFGAVGGALASLFLALWMFFGGPPEAGMLIYVALLQGIIILKAIGYRRNPTPSAGTQREVDFYNRYSFTGLAIIGGYYFWGQRHGMEIQLLFASIVVIAGMWYIFYAISAPSRSLSLAGAVPLIVGGFALPEARGLPQTFCWLGVIAGLGCAFEAALLLAALRQTGGTTNPSASATSPVANPPNSPAPAHAAH
jgi:hypothetical protein